MAEALRAAWEVRAGVVPGMSMFEYQKTFYLTSRQWDEGSEAGATEFLRVRNEAHEYAKSITNPAYINWVSVEFIWF